MFEETQKKESEELVTKGYLDKKLDEKLESFVTKDYLDKKLDEKLKDFVTKDHLNERFDIFTADIDLRFDQFEEKIDEKMREQTATLLQAVDKVITRFDDAEKDEAAHDALHGRITDDVHEHDKRIKKLEVAMG